MQRLRQAELRIDGIVEAVEMGVGWTIARFRRLDKRNCETKISNAR